MQNLELTFANQESSLSVRSFCVDLAMSTPFVVSIVARSPVDDLDLDAFVGQGASFRLGAIGEGGPYRQLTGIVAHMEQLEAENAGLSTYSLRIVPTLWRTTQRRNSRIFQHLSVPEIVRAVLAEWSIDPVLELDLGAFPALEYKVQYGETDFAFVSRLLEEAGIAYVFRDPDPVAGTVETQLVLRDEPHRGLARPMPLTWYAGEDQKADVDIARHVVVARDVRPGRVTVRDFDFRSRVDFALLGEAHAGDALEQRLEQYDYEPGAFLVEPAGPGSPTSPAARVDEREAAALASRRLEGLRQGRRRVAYETNVLDLAPGAVFSIEGHPRHELGKGRRLLAIEQRLEGTHDAAWTASGIAVFADDGYRPACTTPRPRIAGLQSALVVGPPGEEIHTDEHGRVRVQFHWDREGQRDNESSCFVRVGHAWAGRGFGAITIPRVGEEVLVGFYEGDPDQPVVVGSVYNSASPVPYKLPQQKTRSGIRSNSTPGSGGFNEIMFEDAKGGELFFVHAERDLDRVVGRNETAKIGAARATEIGEDESHKVGGDQLLQIAGGRTSVIEGSDNTTVGASYTLSLANGGASIQLADGRIVLSTGAASLVLEGSSVYVDAASDVHIASGESLALSGGEVHVDGQPNVFVNTAGATPATPVALGEEALQVSLADLVGTPEDSAFESLVAMPVLEPGAAPDVVALPAYLGQQLDEAIQKIIAWDGPEQLDAAIRSKEQMIEEALKKKADAVRAKLKDIGEDLRPKVEAARKEANARLEQARALIEKVKAEASARIAELKARAAELRAKIEAKIAEAKEKAEELRARAKAIADAIHKRVEEVRERAKKLVDDIKQRILDAKKRIKASFDDLKKRAKEAIDKGKAIVDQVRGAIAEARQAWKSTIDQFKQEIADVRDTIKGAIEQVKGEIEQAKEQVKQLVGEVKDDVHAVKAGLKGLWTDTKAEAKDAAKEVKEEWKGLKQDAKDAVHDAKDDVHAMKQEAKDAVDEAKQAAKDVKQDAKDAVQQAKDAAKQAKDEVKDAEQEAKQGDDLLEQAKDAQNKSLQLGGDVGGGIPHGALPGGGQVQPGLQFGKNQPGFDLGAFAQQAQGSGNGAAGQIAAFAPGGLDPHGALGAAGAAGVPGLGAGTPGMSILDQARSAAGGASSAEGSIVTRAGGFGGAGMAEAVNASKGVTFLQSPSEGQLMIVRTQQAMSLSPDRIGAAVVEHQMNGATAADAFTSVLGEHGYAVYERPWGDAAGSFVKKAVL